MVGFKRGRVKRGGERYFMLRIWRKSETEQLRWRQRQRGG